MAVAGSLTYETEIDKKGFEKGLKGLKNVAITSMKAITTGVVAATTAVAGLVTASVKSYAEYEQLVGGVDTLFKDSSEKVQEYANNAYKTAGLSANQYMDTVTSFSASLLQSLGNDTDKAADYAQQAIVDMSDNANKMGTDMSMIQSAYQGFAKQNYTMLDNLKLGYGGTKTEMERLIADANRVKKANGEMANLSIDSFADITEAIHIIQTEMGITGTTAKEANETIEGSLNAVKGAWQNLLVGMTAESDWDALIQNLVETVTTAGKNILPAIKSALVGVSALVRDLFPILAKEIPALIIDILPSLVKTGSDIVNSLVIGLKESLPELISGAMKIIMTLITTIIEMLPQILDMGMQIIIQLILGIAQQLPSLIPQIIDAVILIVDTLLDNLDLLIEAGIDLIIALALGLVEAIPKLLEKIPEIVVKIVTKLTEPAMIGKLVEAAITLIIALGLGLIQAIPKLLVMIPQVISSIVEGFTKYDWKALGRSLLEGLLNGFSNVGNIVWEAIKKVGSSMVDGIKNFFGIHSPSRLFAELGQYLPQGFAVGIEADTDSALKAIDNMNDDIINEMNRAVVMETGSINANASVKSNNSMLNVIQATFNLDSSIEMEGQKVARIITPRVVKNIKAGGVA